MNYVDHNFNLHTLSYAFSRSIKVLYSVHLSIFGKKIWSIQLTFHKSSLCITHLIFSHLLHLFNYNSSIHFSIQAGKADGALIYCNQAVNLIARSFYLSFKSCKHSVIGISGPWNRNRPLAKHYNFIHANTTLISNKPSKYSFHLLIHFFIQYTYFHSGLWLSL